MYKKITSRATMNCTLIDFIFCILFFKHYFKTKTLIMHTTLISVMVILGIGMASCNDNYNSTTGTATETTITNSSAMGNNNMNNDVFSSAFITQAAEGGAMEVELGKIAQVNAKSKDVKDFGTMMVKDHNAGNAELKIVAAQKNITLSDDLGEHQHHVDEIKLKKGADFDKAYVNMMVEDHEKDITAFETASKSKDSAVSAFASKTLPVLIKHLEAIKAIQAKIQK